jgi:hypothetical protein
MRLTIIALALAASPAFAADMGEARDLRDQCEHAWFKSSRDEATRALLDMAEELALTLSPFSPTYERDIRAMRQLNDWLGECLELQAQG